MSSLSVFVRSSLYHENQRVSLFVVVSMPYFMFSKKDAVGDEYPMNTVKKNEIGIQSTPGTNDGVSNDSSGKYFERWKYKNRFRFA
jgi:hypothetical protein